MAQTIITLCDPHEDDGHKGTPQLVSLDGVRVYVVDLCDEARSELVGPLAELVSEYGRVVPSDELDAIRRTATKTKTKTKTKDATPLPQYPCPECTARPMIRSTMRKHLEREHKPLTLPIHEARLGRTLDGHEVRFWCSRCGGGFSHGQGLAVHERMNACKPVEDAVSGSSNGKPKPRKRAAKRATS